MNHGRQPAGWGPVRAGAHALAIFAVAALGTGGVAFATGPNAGGAPPEHAQGDGKPEAPPAAQQAPAPSEEGQAKQPSTPATEVQSGGDAHGMTGGGHSKARGKGHTGSTGQSKSGSGTAKANAGKTTICHATGSETNPYVTITVSNNALPAHRAHQNGEDIIPAPGGVCPGGSENGGGPDNENGKVTICHATGSETNPYVVITISENAVEAHRNHQNGEDIIPAPGGVCPSTVIPPGVGNPPSGIVSPPGGEQGAGQSPAGDVLGVSEESGSGPGEDEGEDAVLGANQGGGGEEGAVPASTGTSLPFTGLGLGLLAAIGLLLALSGGHLRRKAS